MAAALLLDCAPIILAVLDGQWRGSRIWLVSANTDYREIAITEETEFEVWGVVRHAML